MFGLQQLLYRKDLDDRDKCSLFQSNNVSISGVVLPQFRSGLRSGGFFTFRSFRLCVCVSVFWAYFHPDDDPPVSPSLTFQVSL